MQPFLKEDLPRAFLHVDGDAFFASCEQALNPALKGKPVITGKERGIASAVSYEARRLGIMRSMPISEIKRLCPDVIWLPSDYETYSLFSKRMYAIVRRYTAMVEEYGIDECFGEITGLQRPLRASYEALGKQIKHDLETELGMTFSVGLAPSKVLSKLASKWNKPSGFTTIKGTRIHEFLEDLPIERIWGIGYRTTAYVGQFDITTALEFAMKPEWWIKENLNKPYQEIWYELRGISVLPIVRDSTHTPKQSISKTKTFTPPSSDPSFILSQFSKNAENACIKLRRHALATKRVFIYLKTQDFRYKSYELEFSQPLAHPSEIIKEIEEHLMSIYKPGVLYRATGLVLTDLSPAHTYQLDFFGTTAMSKNSDHVFGVVDSIDRKYGKHTVFLGSSYRALSGRQYQGDRNDQGRRSRNLFAGEGRRRRVGLPYLGEVK